MKDLYSASHNSVSLGIVVLAAGVGSRFKSALPKVLHPLAGRPMLDYVLRTAEDLAPDRIVVVAGYRAQEVEGWVNGRAHVVIQSEQLGTGHAVLQSRPVLSDTDEVLVLYGDVPLVRAQSLLRLLDLRRGAGAVMAVLSFYPEDPSGYGRIIRDSAGSPIGIVEEREADEKQRAVGEVNSGICAFDGRWLWRHLDKIEAGTNGEYYLTSLARAAAREGGLAVVPGGDSTEFLGVNDRIQLAKVEAIVRDRIRHRLMEEGVTLIDPSSTFIDEQVEIGPDTVIFPQCFLEGETVIGRGCRIGPMTRIVDSFIGDGSMVVMSVIEGSWVEGQVDIGPFSHLRPGSRIEKGVHIGNFVEVKASTVGAGSRMGHFSYIGDAAIGRDVNVGAGTVTCNFDGIRKHRTTVGDKVFLGSDTMLVAPVNVGEGAMTGAGSVVTKDIPPYSVAYGVPARVVKEKAHTSLQEGKSADSGKGSAEGTASGED